MTVRARRPTRRALLGATSLSAALTLGACRTGPAGLGASEAACAPGDEPEPAQPEPLQQEGPDGTVDVAPPDASILLAGTTPAFSPDGRRVATAEATDRYRLQETDTAGTTVWDLEQGSIVTRFADVRIGPVAWHPDGTALATDAGAHVAVVDPGGTPLWYLTGHQDPGIPRAAFRSFVFTPDGALLVSLHNDGNVRLWDVGPDRCSPGRVLDTRHLDPRAMDIAPDGSRLAVGGPDGAPELWDLATGKRTDTVEGVEGEVHDLRFAADGTLVLATRTPSALCAVLGSGEVRTLDLEGNWVTTLDVAPDGLATAVTDDPAAVRLWDPASDEVTALPAAPGEIAALRWSPDGATLCAVSLRTGLMIWDGQEWSVAELP